MKTLRAVTALAVALGPGVAAAQTATSDLEERVKILERRLELADEEKQARAREAATPAAGEKGFGFKSADGGFEFKLRGLLHLDGRFFADDEQTLNDTFLLRRVEPSFELTLGTLAFFKLQPQFAGDSATTSDVYGELRFDPAVGLRFGKFKAPFGLENLQSSGALAFMERGLPTEVGAGRDIGVQLQGEVFAGTTTYAVSYTNGAPDGRDAAAGDSDNHKEVAARLFFEPFKNEPGILQGFGFGVGATQGSKAGAPNSATFNNTLPRYRSPGQNTIFTYLLPATGATLANTVVAAGDHRRLGPQLYWYAGSFGLLAEQTRSEQEVSLNGVAGTFEHDAWQVVASYVLTGEGASYRGFKPASPYAAGGGWGAFEVALRHGVLDIDDGVFPVYANPAASVREAENTGVALNWHLTGNARISLDYEITAFEGGAAAGDRRDEKALLTRLQLSF